MRLIIRALLSILLIGSGASLALAEVHPSSPLAPTDPQPFTFSCAPYAVAFVAGNYYTPTEGGACTYTLPAIQGAFRILELYKGTVGNATLVEFDFTDPSSNPYTSLETFPNNFGGVQGDNYFAVVYGVNDQTELDAADTYFKTGSGSPPTNGFSSLAWKWGTPPPPPPSDTTAPSITITSPLKNGLYKKTDSVLLTATITDASPIVTTTYWLNGKKINPANPLDLSSAPIVSKVSVSATDSFGNTATSTQAFFVVKSTNSCLLDIIAILTAIIQDNTLPDKPTLQNLIADCSALLKGLHRYDDKGNH